MIEKFDNRSKQAGEFLEIPQRLAILADAIIDTVGHNLAGYDETVKRAEWTDPRTNTIIKLQKQLEEDNTKYFIEEYDTTDYDSEIEPFKEFYFDSEEGYNVRLLGSDHRTFISSEHDSAPSKELLGILTHGPVDTAPLLKQLEKGVVDDRFQHIVGRYALEKSDVLRRKIYGAHSRKDPESKERALQKIAETMTVYEISAHVAHQAIEGFYRDHRAKRDKKVA